MDQSHTQPDLRFQRDGLYLNRSPADIDRASILIESDNHAAQSLRTIALRGKCVALVVSSPNNRCTAQE